MLRATQYCKGIDIAEGIRPGVRDAVLRGKIRITMKEAMTIASAEPDEQKELTNSLGIHTTRLRSPNTDDNAHLNHIGAEGLMNLICYLLEILTNEIGTTSQLQEEDNHD